MLPRMPLGHEGVRNHGATGDRGRAANPGVEGAAMTRRHYGALVGLLITWSACTVAHRSTLAARAAPLSVDRLERAIAVIESGNRNLAPRWDVNGLAFGIHQYHLPRWVELGGTRANFGKASEATQRRLFRAALSRKNFKTFEAVARWHNGAGRAHYAYAKKLEREYAKCRN